MSTHRPALDPCLLNDRLAGFYEIVRSYLDDHLCTVQLAEVVGKGSDPSWVDVRPLILPHDAKTALNDAGLIISDVPVMMPKGGVYSISYDLGPQDIGLLLACQYDIAAFTQNFKPDGGNRPAPAPSWRTFNWSNGVFIPLSITAPTSGLVLKNNTVSLTLSGSEVTIDGAVVINGDLQVSNSITAKDIKANAAVSAASVAATGGVTIAGKSFKDHFHTGVTGGMGNSGPPG